MSEHLPLLDAILASDSTELKDYAKLCGDERRFFLGANLCGVDLRGQNLRGMSFAGANFMGAICDSETKWDAAAADLVLIKTSLTGIVDPALNWSDLTRCVSLGLERTIGTTTPKYTWPTELLLAAASNFGVLAQLGVRDVVPYADEDRRQERTPQLGGDLRQTTAVRSDNPRKNWPIHSCSTILTAQELRNLKELHQQHDRYMFMALLTAMQEFGRRYQMRFVGEIQKSKERILARNEVANQVSSQVEMR